MWQKIYLTQDIGRGLSKAKRSITEREIKMYLISHHLFKSNKFLRDCVWTEHFPVDQLVDEHDKLLKFETKEEAIDYVKEVELQVPLVSNHGTPLQIPEGVDPWEYWMDWLSERGLFSAITGYRHIPEHIRLQREMRRRQRQRQSVEN